MFRGSEKPTEVAQLPIYSAKCTVWATISERVIIRPFFFKEHGAQVTVMKEHYEEVLEDFINELETQNPSLITKFWLQQDGAWSHTSNMS